MGTVLNSFDNMIASAQSNGMLLQLLADRITGNTTAALATCGGISSQRYPNPFIVPSFGGGLSGMFVPSFDIVGSGVGIYLGAVEILLGTLTVSGNSYSHGSAIGTRHDPGDDTATITAAASLIMAVVTTALTATTPTLTFNYTNQDGTTGRSGSITLPSSPAINTAFLCTPHLQDGDTGIRQLSASSPNGLSIDTGSAGVIKLYGLLPLAASCNASGGVVAAIDPLLVSNALYHVVDGDSIAIYRFGNTALDDVIGFLTGVADD